MSERNAPDLLHAVGEKGIAGCGKQSDSGEHQILAKGHALDLDRLRRHCSICLFAPFLDPLVPHGAHFKEGLCFFIEPLAFPAIEDRFPQDAERSLRRSEEHTSELQSPCNLVCRLLLEKKKKKKTTIYTSRHHKTVVDQA